MKRKIRFIHQHDGLTESTIYPYVVNLNNGFHRFSVEVDGEHYTTCVEVNNTDKIMWYYRGDRRYASPIVTGRLPERTNKLSIVCRVTNNEIIIITAFYGNLAPKEPATCTKDELYESIDFWSTHALIMENGMEHFLANIPQWYQDYIWKHKKTV